MTEKDQPQSGPDSGAEEKKIVKTGERVDSLAPEVTPTAIRDLQKQHQEKQVQDKPSSAANESKATLNFGDQSGNAPSNQNRAIGDLKGQATYGRSLGANFDAANNTAFIKGGGDKNPSHYKLSPQDKQNLPWTKQGYTELTPFGGNRLFGLDYSINKKSEFQRETKAEDWKIAPADVDNFLRQTAPAEDKGLTRAEKLELQQTRQALAQTNDARDILSNALHLARLYQHLRYIEEAKKAIALALSIDPENMLGKQMFTELERMHPVDLGNIHFAPGTEEWLKKSNLRRCILNLSKGRVIVLGDLLIDELLEGKPVRISREAPVLILEHSETELVCGGAANTAHNITALGGSCHAIGICGKDEYAGRLAHILEDCGVSHSLVEDATRPTTVKTRILSKNHAQLQQLLRLDRISHEPVAASISEQLVQKLQAVAKDYQAVILSDYRSGAISDQVVEACRRLAASSKLLVMVDAQETFERFKGFTLMTPNQPDTENAVGYSIKNMADLKRAGTQIIEQTGIEALLITRGASGMALFQKGKEVVELPAFNKSDVFDVTGAGDTVIATMALAVVSGASFAEAMALGNLAAGIVVKKAGTAVTNQRELLHNLEALDIPE